MKNIWMADREESNRRATLMYLVWYLKYHPLNINGNELNNDPRNASGIKWFHYHYWCWLMGIKVWGLCYQKKKRKRMDQVNGTTIEIAVNGVWKLTRLSSAEWRALPLIFILPYVFHCFISYRRCVEILWSSFFAVVIILTIHDWVDTTQRCPIFNYTKQIRHPALNCADKHGWFQPEISAEYIASDPIPAGIWIIFESGSHQTHRFKYAASRLRFHHFQHFQIHKLELTPAIQIRAWLFKLSAATGVRDLAPTVVELIAAGRVSPFLPRHAALSTRISGRELLSRLRGRWHPFFSIFPFSSLFCFLFRLIFVVAAVVVIIPSPIFSLFFFDFFSSPLTLLPPLPPSACPPPFDSSSQFTCHFAPSVFNDHAVPMVASFDPSFTYSVRYHSTTIHLRPFLIQFQWKRLAN